MGVGTTDGGVVPDFGVDGTPLGPKRDRAGNTVRSRLDPRSLRKLAETGGEVRRYFEVGTGDFDVALITEALDNLKRGALEKKNERVMYELYHFFLFPGFLLLLIEACIGTRRRVKHPEVQA
jgi:Ca-activated chloride channel family protein